MRFVIWSFKHGQWWGARRSGYTPRLEEAGEYTAAEAGDIVTDDITCQSVAIPAMTAERMGPPTVKGLWT